MFSHWYDFSSYMLQVQTVLFTISRTLPARYPMLSNWHIIKVQLSSKCTWMPPFKVYIWCFCSILLMLYTSYFHVGICYGCHLTNSWVTAPYLAAIDVSSGSLTYWSSIHDTCIVYHWQIVNYSHHHLLGIIKWSNGCVLMMSCHIKT